MNDVDMSAAPDGIWSLPRDARGQPVPWWIGNAPRSIGRALAGQRCWTCGKRLVGKKVAFIVDVLDGVARTSPEPPSHVECAAWAVRHCPQLSQLLLERCAGGELALVYVTWRWRPIQTRAGMSFHLGEPVEARFFARGKPPSRAAVLDALRAICGPSTLPIEDNRRSLERLAPAAAEEAA